MQTMLMYPTNATSLISGKGLLLADHNLSLYCPHPVHQRQAGTVPADLTLAAKGVGRTVQVVENLASLGDMDFIIFPLLDILPHMTRSEYGRMCRELFRWVGFTAFIFIQPKIICEMY